VTGSALGTRHSGQKVPQRNAKVFTQPRQMFRWDRLRSPFVSLDDAVLDAKNSGDIDFGKPQRDAFALDAAGHMPVQPCHLQSFVIFSLFVRYLESSLLTTTQTPRQLIFENIHCAGHSILASVSERSTWNLNGCGIHRVGTRR
jgi:hypothetical protein